MSPPGYVNRYIQWEEALALNLVICSYFIHVAGKFFFYRYCSSKP